MTILKIIRRCEDCGKEFDGPAQMFCIDCRRTRLDSFNVDHEQRISDNRELNRNKWLANAKWGIPSRYRDLAWSAFRYDKNGGSNRGKVIKIQDYSELMPTDQSPSGYPSMLIARDLNGVGKTMLASMIVQSLVNRCMETHREKSPFQFWPVAKIKQRIRSAERFGSVETVEDVYQDFATMWLLVIDDVGKERLDGADVAFTYEMYYSIINERYNNQLPVVITSNLKFEPWGQGGISLVDLMGRGCVDRLMEMVGENAYVIDGEGWR